MSTQLPNGPVNKLYSMLLMPFANSYRMLTAASATSAETRSGCFAASRYDEGPPPDQHMTAKVPMPSLSMSAISRSAC